MAIALARGYVSGSGIQYKTTQVLFQPLVDRLGNLQYIFWRNLTDDLFGFLVDNGDNDAVFSLGHFKVQAALILLHQLPYLGNGFRHPATELLALLASNFRLTC